MQDTSLAGQDLGGRDLRNTDLRGKVLYETDLRGAKLYGADISLTCATFHGVKLDEEQVALFLLLISMARLPDGWAESLSVVLREHLSSTKLNALVRYLKLHI